MISMSSTCTRTALTSRLAGRRTTYFAINSRQLKFYIYQLPSDQSAGTFFYHPHVHGSVATLVAGGMGGPLIVRDPLHGLDELGTRSGWGIDKESILMFQQLTLYSQSKAPTVRFARPDFFALKDMQLEQAVNCSDRPDIKKVARRLAGDPQTNLSPIFKHDIETWVSGMFQPQVCNKVAFGEIRRMRLIHAGVEDTIDLAIRPTTPGRPAAMIQVIAWDGIPLKQPYFISDAQHLTLSPGNRADVLVCIPRASGDISRLGEITYSVVSRAPTATDSDLVLATLVVDPKKPLDGKPSFVSDAEARRIFASCAPALSPPAIPTVEAYNLSFADASFNSDNTFQPGTFKINGAAFPGDEKFFRLGHSRRLAFAVPDGDSNHPLHIHVNPFLVPADPDRGTTGLPTCEFWADTLLILKQQPPLNVVMPFHHWSGKSVSHCHILDHEDAGMMGLIHIRPDVFSWPEFSVPSIMEMHNIPRAALDDLRQTWPVPSAKIIQSIPNKVSLYVFMPANASGEPCAFVPRRSRPWPRFASV